MAHIPKYTSTKGVKGVVEIGKKIGTTSQGLGDR